MLHIEGWRTWFCLSLGILLFLTFYLPYNFKSLRLCQHIFLPSVILFMNVKSYILVGIWFLWGYALETLDSVYSFFLRLMLLDVLKRKKNSAMYGHWYWIMNLPLEKVSLQSWNDFIYLLLEVSLSLSCPHVNVYFPLNPHIYSKA
jgi:hypothetical protein